MDALIRAIREDEAVLNITWKGQNGDLQAPVFFQSSDADVRQMATEAVRAGLPGIDPDPNVNFRDFIVERFGPNDQNPTNRIYLRPKATFGA